MKNAASTFGSSKFRIATNPESKTIIRTKAIATAMLANYKSWTDDQRNVLASIANRGYVVGDIWAILATFGKSPDWHPASVVQRGICIPFGPVSKRNGANMYKSQLTFTLL